MKKLIKMYWLTQSYYLQCRQFARDWSILKVAFWHEKHQRSQFWRVILNSFFSLALISFQCEGKSFGATNSHSKCREVPENLNHMRKCL